MTNRTRLIAVAIFVAALLPRFLIVIQPIPVQLDRTLPDDAYYYFLTAQHIVAGEGPSVDGRNDSNGWHPLWMLINMAVYSFDYGDRDTPIRIVMLIGAVFDSLVAVLIYLAARRYLDQGAAVIGSLFYAINSMPIFQAVNGLETGLGALAIALAWWLTLQLVRQPSRRLALVWGAIFGIAFLARTDTALILVWLGLFTAWRLRARLHLIVLGAVVALALVMPWWVWNTVNFGSPLVQVSSVAVPWAARERFMLANPDAPLWQESLRVLTWPFYWLRGDYFGAPPFLGPLLWLLALVGLVRARRRGPNPVVTAALLVLLGGLLLIGIHTMARLYPRAWYFVAMAQALALGLACFWWTLGSARVRLATLAVTASLVVLSGWQSWQIGYHSWQRQHQYATALWARDNTDDDAILASMNSGIIGYYSDRTTINLDGVVNPNAFAAIRSDALLDYMRTSGVDYFLDSDNALRNEYGVFMGDDYPDGLREIAVITEAYPGLGHMRVYDVIDEAEALSQ